MFKARLHLNLEISDAEAEQSGCKQETQKTTDFKDETQAKRISKLTPNK